MKKYLWLAPVMLLAAACKPETDNTASLSATPTEIEFAATGGAAQTIAVTAKNVGLGLLRTRKHRGMDNRRET